MISRNRSRACWEICTEDTNFNFNQAVFSLVHVLYHLSLDFDFYQIIASIFFLFIESIQYEIEYIAFSYCFFFLKKKNSRDKSKFGNENKGEKNCLHLVNSFLVL